MMDNGVMYHGIKVFTFRIDDAKYNCSMFFDTYDDYSKYATENRSRILCETFNIDSDGNGMFNMFLSTK